MKYRGIFGLNILTKINCITLKIHSKADSKSKSQNIWHQIILFSRTVMQVTQDLNSFGEIIAHTQCSVDGKKSKYIPCVPHKNNCKKKIGSHDMKQTDSSIIIVRNVCVLTSASMIVYLFFTRSWLAIIGPNFSSRGHDRQSSEQNNRKLISLHNNGEDDKHAHGFADF
jgi:hypothetical protein